ncbi:MAG: hypothetical protein V3U92_05670 [Cellulophaga sp.]
MKTKLIFTFILILCLSCGTAQKLESAKQNTIIYIFPSQVENALKDHFLNLENIDEIYLELKREKDIFLLFINDSNIFWKTKTNRKVVVENKLYPLIFDTDSFFGSAEDAELVLKRLKSESKEKPFLRKTITPIYDNVFMLKFKRNGEILYKGSSW